jgi:hypothetical protein
MQRSGCGAPAQCNSAVAFPLSGLRVDFVFEGLLHGRVAGEIRGVDYVLMRPEGGAELDIGATITTGDGTKIALSPVGTTIPQPNSTVSSIREAITLTAASDAYSWANGLHIFRIGAADVARGEIKVRSCAPE